MPLTMYCYELTVDVYRRYSHQSYATRELVISGTYRLTNLGKEKLRYMESIDDRIKAETQLERSTLGTIALWFLRKNERRRQIEAVKTRGRDLDWQTLRDKYRVHRDEIISRVYTWVLQEAYDYLDTIVKDKNWILLQTNVEDYIRDQKKRKTSVVSTVYDRFPYEFIVEHANLPKIAKHFMVLIKLIMDNIFSEKRLNWRFILSAIRNRPFDLEEFSFGHAVGTMSRSREANGQPPFSLLWMMVYPEKKRILKEALNRIELIYKVKFYDPIRHDNFYYLFTHFVDGLYLFGDNGILIRNGTIIGIYDLSISDVWQAWVRQEEGKNFCFFLWIGEGYDCGSTGDAFTTLWNIEGQVFLWWCFNQGYLTTGEEVPYVKNLSEPTGGFLGHYYDDEAQDWYGAGVKTTGDSVLKAIPFTLNRHGRTSESWDRKKYLKENEILSLLIVSGVGDIRIKRFYEWVEEWKWAAQEMEEIYSTTEKIEKILELSSVDELLKFSELSNLPLADYAYPYLLQKN